MELINNIISNQIIAIFLIKIIVNLSYNLESFLNLFFSLFIYGLHFFFVLILFKYSK